MLVVDDRYNGDKLYNERNLTDMIVAHDPTEANRWVVCQVWMGRDLILLCLW